MRLAPSILRKMSLYRRPLLCALLLLAWLLLGAGEERGSTAAFQPLIRLQVRNNYRRVGRYSVSRTPYDSNAVATYQRCRLILAGDVEFNPGPQTTPARPQRSLTVFLHNPRSLKNKLGSLRAGAGELQKYDVIAWTETWLTDQVLDSELQVGFPEHTWLRRDRDGVGGGVACAVRSSLLPMLTPEQPDDSEMLLLRLGALSVTVAVCYRPPDSSTSLERIMTCLEQLPAGHRRLIVMGDFNLPEISWTQTAGGCTAHLRRASARGTCFLDWCQLLGLKQWVHGTTRGDNTLDLVLTRDISASVTARDSLLPSDHMEVVGACHIPVTRPPLVTRSKVFNYRRADFNGLRLALRAIPWDLLEDLPVDEAVDDFYTLLEAAIADHVPVVTLGRSYPPWFSREVRAALRQKEAAYRRLRRNRQEETDRDFTDKRRVFKNLANGAYIKYLRDLTDDFRTNPKRMWSFLKCFNRKGGTAPILTDGVRKVSDSKERAELLNRTFAAKFTDPSASFYPDVISHSIFNLSTLRVTSNDVRRVLLSIPSGKACGPDNISSRIIKECAEELVAPLTILCQLSFKQGVFPSKWKQANVVPIHKSGDRTNPRNYRSISLLPLFGRVLEKIACDILMQHVRPVISDAQHGFLSGRSCTTNLAVYLSHAWETLSEGCQTDVIYTDFSAAFQSVNHKLLLHKLQNYFHIEEHALNWFVSYLSGRAQRVVLNGKTSAWTPVISGTPEGGILSPLLFCLYVNDLPFVAESHSLMYVDDLKLFRCVRSVDDSVLLQKDLNHVSDWAETWKLALNASKCKTMSLTLKRNPVQYVYTVRGTVLEKLDTMRDLGVMLDSKLTFSPHVDSVVSKARRALGVLMRSFQLCHRQNGLLNEKAIMAAYIANVRSILEYGSQIWAGAASTHLDRIERVQHKFLLWLAHRTATGRQARDLSYDALLDLFKLQTLASRRQQHDIVFLHNIIQGRCDSMYLLSRFSIRVPSRSTRYRAAFFEPVARVNTIKNGMFCRLPRLTNDFLVRCPTVDMFCDGKATIIARLARCLTSDHL